MANDVSARAALASTLALRGLAHRARSLAPSGPRAPPRVPRHSPRQAVQCQSRLANTAHSISMLLAVQHDAAPACSRRCGAAAPPPRLVHGAGARRHGPPPVAGRKEGAHLPKEAPRCSLSTRSFAQRSARATPRKADPQSAREAVCGRPGKRALASSAAMPSARASEQREDTTIAGFPVSPIFFVYV